jgi:hypothetical protein
LYDLSEGAEILTKMGRKKDKKSRNRRFLRVFLENGVVGDGKKCDFIGLLRF